ncbi:MAG: GntR family transcriptional regulator [Anaerolineae bacterium]|nr:GntR family transcriptional regulator [Anaerolineae bacterium]
MKREWFTIDHYSSAPLYSLIAQNVRDLISQQRLKPGDALPSEWELSDYYGTSRLTVRRALDDLSREGWVRRRHGVGTFVANPKSAQIAPSKLSFTQQMLAIGRVPGSQLLNVEIVPASEEAAARLNIKPETPVVEITRLRLADNEPILLETAVLPAERFPGLENTGTWTNDSLYETLEVQYNTKVTVMDQTLEPIILDEKEALWLHSQPGSPAMYSEVVSYAEDETPIEYSWSITPGERSKFFFSFRRSDTPA